MASTIENVEIGTVDVTIDAVSLGHTLGGAILTFEKEFAELKVDKYASPVDYALTGQNLMVKVTLAEPTVANLAIANPEGDSTTVGTLGFGTETGWLASSAEVELVMHPVDQVTEAKDVTIFRAVVTENTELNYTVGDQRVLEITFKALPDETQTNGSNLGRVGPAPASS